MLDVITVGSGTIDSFVDTGDRLFRESKGCVSIPFGSKVLVEKLHVNTGGGGTNTAVSFSRLGLKAAWIGKIGCGQNSERIINQMKKEKVDVSLVKCQKGGRTGFSVIIDSKGHDRTILTYKGSNDDLGWDDINKSKVKAKWMYCSSMMGKSFKTLEKLVVFARKKGIKVAFNPSSYLAKKGIGTIRKIVKNTNLLVMNREEAGYLTGIKDAEKAARKLASYGPGIAVVTDGKKKACAYDGNKIYCVKPHNLKVLEATGAGDAFASAFLAGIIKGKGILFSLKLGIKNSESVIRHMGAKNRLLTWKEAVKGIR